MRLDDFRQSDNVDDRRGRGGGGLPIGKGGIGIGGLVVVLLVSYFTGINPATLIGGLDAINGGGSGSQPQQERQLTPEEQAQGVFVRQVLTSTEGTWTALFREQNVGMQYAAPRLVLFDGSTDSACGTAQSAMGPFYCPNDKQVYLDTEFFDEMRNRFKACPVGEGACSFAQAYVIAHEIGHHVQNLLGILPKVNAARERAGEAQSNALSVRVELQADCYAGVWANRTQRQYKFIDEADVRGALQTAQAIGDDMLQKKAQGYVVPDSFTHGSSEQRQRWFITGLKTGQINSCDTFSASQI